MLSFKKLLIPTAVGASLLLAACGSSSTNSTSTSKASSYPAASQPTPTSSAVTIGTANAAGGAYLTGASGRALYIWVADPKDQSTCSGACASAWPPLTASSMPKVTGGVNAADVSLISRPDGSKQVAYDGRPPYYYAGDNGPAMSHGQRSNAFGAKWWLISPSGGPIAGASAAASPSHSTGGSPGTPSTRSAAGGWG